MSPMHHTAGSLHEMPSGLAGLAHLALHWAPVWVPLVLLAQVAFQGLRPARLEQVRLERERAGVEARYQATRERFERMRDEAEAWSDPVYRARLQALLAAERPGR